MQQLIRTFVLQGLIVLAGFAEATAHAQTPTAEGLWKTIDDATQQVRSLVRISQSGGVYAGRIEQVLDTDAKPEDVCEACVDERKNQPIVGLLLIRNVRQSAKDRTIFEGGDILDPEDGKVYRVRLKIEDGGRQLQVRGYVGPFYRSQVWLRER